MTSRKASLPSALTILHGLSEGQVLQRQGRRGATAILRLAGAPDTVWVTVQNGEKPLVGWKARRVSRERRDLFRLVGLPAGGPYRLELATHDSRFAIVTEFFVGDVWVLAGQSNMQGCGRLPGMARPHPAVRVFSLRREWRKAEDPLHIPAESPDPCHHGGSPCSPTEGERLRRTARTGAGVGVLFGTLMHRRTGIPQGLIAAARGGSALAAWDPNRPGPPGDSLFHSLLTSVRQTGQPVAGVLWYQGETDAMELQSAAYIQRMKSLVSATRQALRQPRLPWFTTQLASLHRDCTDAQRREWNAIQNLQLQLPAVIPHLATVPAIDLPLDDGIHIASDGFPALADRMARAAARLALGQRQEPPSPRLAAVLPLRHSPRAGFFLDLPYAHVTGGLQASGNPTGFSFHDETTGQLRDILYRITLRGATVRLHLTSWPRRGTVLWHGHGTAPACTIHNRRNEPLPVQGPIALFPARTLFPFLTTWRVTRPVRQPGGLFRSAPPHALLASAPEKTYGDFINEHASWNGGEGQAYFATTLTLPAPTRLEFLMGYDGPFRIWVDGQPLFDDPRGTNPCFPDQSAAIRRLDAGRHEVVVGLDVNHGRAWGFFLRTALPTKRRASKRPTR